MVFNISVGEKKICELKTLQQKIPEKTQRKSNEWTVGNFKQPILKATEIPKAAERGGKRRKIFNNRTKNTGNIYI